MYDFQALSDGILPKGESTVSLFVSAGSHPYVGFHYLNEQLATPHLTDVAFAIGSKVKSSIFNAAA